MSCPDWEISLVVHAGGGMLVLLVPLALSVYKPRGTTHTVDAGANKLSFASRSQRSEA